MTTETFRDVYARLTEGSQAASAEVFERYARRIIGLARRRLDERLQGKEEPDDILQSVLRSFFVRQRDGKFDLNNWDGLWALLATITARKCNRRLEYWNAEKRNVAQEIHPTIQRLDLTLTTSRLLRTRKTRSSSLT
ncbi:MAG: ECF-type sigma factor [Planctomycetota bacterium]|nr:ECF-type sigma factor [Planctomycetota bacterium]